MKLRHIERLTGWVVIFILIACKDDEPEIDTCLPFTPQVSDQYDFPVRPGMPEWADLQSHEEMLEVFKLPLSIIETISTAGLIETCFDYPLLSLILAFDDLQIGTEQQMADFNGFQELSQRTKAGSLMLQRYEQMKPECLPLTGTTLEQEAFITVISLNKKSST